MTGAKLFLLRCYRLTNGLECRHARYAVPSVYGRLVRTLTLGWQQLRAR